MPEVSIIMPNYNCSAYIAEAIESVIAQTFTDWELIICEDCSTDNSRDIIASYAAKDARIRVYHNEKNMGLARSRNKAIGLASGDYIALLDSDDAWYPQKLEVQLRFMHNNSIDISYAAYDVINEQGKIIDMIIPPPRPIDYRELLKGKRINVPTTLMKRSILPPDPYPSVAAEDLAMWFRIMRRGHMAYLLPAPLARYRLRRNALSSNKLHMAKVVWRMMGEQEKLPLPLRAYFFTFYVVNMIKKYTRILPEVLRLRN